MKKSLLALAVLGAFTGIASAQTSVTIYGVVDAGITREDNGTNVTNRLDSGNQSGSRLGFKGNEDLGGGLSAQFLLEEGFNVDTGTLGQNGALYGRQAYLGLTGNFGQLRLGRQKTVMYDSVLAVDPFGIANKGGMDRLFVTNTIENANIAATQLRGVGRSNNTIAYFTPNIAGFTGEVTYTLGEVGGNNQAGRQYGLSLNYAAGPLFVTLDYLNVNSVPSATVADSTAKTTFLGATYDFGIVKAHAAYGLDKGSVNRTVAQGDADQRDYMVGATIPFGASAVQVDYIRKLDRAGQDAGARQYAVGYTYALSKRTNFYSSYTGTNLNSFNYVANGVPNQIDRVLNVGVRHTF
jgi:predicted porin